MGDFRYFFFKLFLKKTSRIQAWCDFTYFPGGSSQEHFFTPWNRHEEIILQIENTYIPDIFSEMPSIPNTMKYQRVNFKWGQGLLKWEMSSGTKGQMISGFINRTALTQYFSQLGHSRLSLSWASTISQRSRVTLIVGLSPRLNYFLSNFLNFPQISSQILHFLPARLAGWNN